MVSEVLAPVALVTQYIMVGPSSGVGYQEARKPKGGRDRNGLWYHSPL
jgi:hypothetical protein